MRVDASSVLLIVSTVLFWGFWGFFGKAALAHGTDSLSLFVAMVFGSLPLAALLALLFPKYTPAWQNLGIPFGLLAGFCLALGLLTFSFALKRNTVSAILPLTALYPAVAVLLAVGLAGERPRTVQWVGLVLALIAAILVLSGGSESPDT